MRDALENQKELQRLHTVRDFENLKAELSGSSPATAGGGAAVTAQLQRARAL